MDFRFSKRRLRAAMAALATATSLCAGMLGACGSESDVEVAADASADRAIDGSRTTDEPIEPGSDARAPTVADAGAGDAHDSDVDADAADDDAGDDAGEDAGDAALDAAADALDLDAAPPPASHAFGVAIGHSEVTVVVEPTQYGGGACTYGGSPSSATLTTCTATTCAGSANTSLTCKEGTTCDVHFSSSGDRCAACSAGATCTFTDDGSSGYQSYFCAAGSDCTIEVKIASGYRKVDCRLAKRCVVNGSASGYNEVWCPPGADCKVAMSNSRVCCYAPPVTCKDGRVVCPAAGPAAAADAGDGGDAGDAGDAGDPCAP